MSSWLVVKKKKSAQREEKERNVDAFPHTGSLLVVALPTFVYALFTMVRMHTKAKNGSVFFFSLSQVAVAVSLSHSLPDHRHINRTKGNLRPGQRSPRGACKQEPALRAVLHGCDPVRERAVFMMHFCGDVCSGRCTARVSHVAHPPSYCLCSWSILCSLF